MKSDARVRYTKHVIQKVFLELLKDKPISKITVKEICEKADINRGTFYKHYEDVYNLMKKLEDAALEQLESLLHDSMENGNVPVLITLLTSLLNYQELVESLAANSSSNDFLNKLADCCSRYAVSQLSTTDTFRLDDPNKQYEYSYLAGGTKMLIEQWMKTGAKETPAEIAEKIEKLNQLILSADLNFMVL